MLRLVFMGTSDFAVPALEALSQHHKVVAVYSQPDRPVGRGLELSASPVTRKAKDLGFPIFQPERLSQTGEFERLAEMAPDVIVVAAYGQLLKRNILELPRLGCFNIHGSLLPRWRGAAPIHWALLSGDTETGITIIKMVEKLDAGPILLKKKIPIQAIDTTSTLHGKLSTLGASLMIQALQSIEQGGMTEEGQDESLVTYASKLTKDMQWLNPLVETANALDRKVRALNPWPGSCIKVRQEGRLKIHQARLQEALQGRPGELFESAGLILLGTPKGCLELTELQWEGRSATNVAGFLNGLKGHGKTLPLQIESFPK